MSQPTPPPIAALQAAYGPPSSAGFGSAVFHAPVPTGSDLTAVATDRYREFVGDLWDRFGADAWRSTWREVYQRPPGTRGDIVSELRGITDVTAGLSVPLLLDVVEGAQQARAALAAVFDSPAMSQVRVFTIGDGAAMSGLLLAGLDQQAAATILTLLMD